MLLRTTHVVPKNISIKKSAPLDLVLDLILTSSRTA